MSDAQTAKTPTGPDAKTAIKICGLKDVDTALHAARSGPDFIGLNRVKASPRYVNLDTARSIVAAIRDEAPAVRVVGLFCDHDAEVVRHEYGILGLDVAQLHGRETREQVASLNEMSVWKALSFNALEIDAWRDAPSHVTALLIDTPHRQGELTGGTGRAFDWDALAALDRTGLPPLMLAGGLTPDNVGEAIRTVRPWGVDVSSGVESSRGVKDPARIAAFCDAVRAADESMRR